MRENLLEFGRANRNFGSHRRIIWALLMRELSTRYGRDNIGFLWVIGEPLIFCAAVTVMWSIIRGPYEHGVKMIPFTVTGYMAILMSRHMIGHGVHCVKANQALLYHRSITPLHLFICRLTLEFLGVTLAFVVIFSTLALFGLMELPKDPPLLYLGWFMLAWQGAGIAMILGALAELFEFIEKIVQLFTYIMMPMSGTFFMASWIPGAYRHVLLSMPFIHPVEMIRGGFFGEFVTTYFDVAYVAAWNMGFFLVGLFLVQFIRDRVEIE